MHSYLEPQVSSNFLTLANEEQRGGGQVSQGDKNSWLQVLLTCVSQVSVSNFPP